MYVQALLIGWFIGSFLLSIFAQRGIDRGRLGNYPLFWIVVVGLWPLVGLVFLIVYAFVRFVGYTMNDTTWQELEAKRKARREKATRDGSRG